MSSDAWKKENTVQILLRVTRSSGIPDALRKMQEKTGIATSEYIRKILRENLVKDGYLSENQPEK